MAFYTFKTNFSSGDYCWILEPTLREEKTCNRCGLRKKIKGYKPVKYKIQGFEITFKQCGYRTEKQIRYIIGDHLYANANNIFTTRKIARLAKKNRLKARFFTKQLKKFNCGISTTFDLGQKVWYWECFRDTYTCKDCGEQVEFDNWKLRSSKICEIVILIDENNNQIILPIYYHFGGEKWVEQGEIYSSKKRAMNFKKILR